MGAGSSKDCLQLYLKRLSESEVSQCHRIFRAIAQENDQSKVPLKCFSFDQFLDYVGRTLTSLLAKQIYNGMSSLSDKQLWKGVYFATFVQYMCCVVKGTYEEQGKAFAYIVAEGNSSTTISRIRLVLEDVASVLPNVLSKSQHFQSWKFPNHDSLVTRLSKLFFFDLFKKDKMAKEKWESQTISIEAAEIEQMFTEESLIGTAFTMIINNALPLSQENLLKFHLPLCTGANWAKVTSLLDLPSLLLLNHSLPSTLREVWHLLYSSNIHGASFSTLMGHILKKGPTLIIIKDKDEYVFGGFASLDWNFYPKFVGNQSCFIFKLHPDLKVYESSGMNNNYMYLSLHQRTLPNGLGFGGQMNNFGLWIDSEFDHGHSILSCATYRSELLSGKEQYEVDTVEVWRVGPPRNEEEEVPRKSVLDSEVTVKAMLTMINKVGNSEGLRELGVDEETTCT